MQFKKNFSSNLQNLSIKKTSIMNPPPSHNSSTSSYLSSSRPSNTTMHNYRQCITGIQDGGENKENSQRLNKFQNGEGEGRGTERSGSKGRGGPVMTFKAIRNGFFPRDGQESGFALKPAIKSNNIFSSKKLQPKLILKQSNSLHNLRTSNPVGHSSVSSNVRLGSMVFNSLPKNKDQAQQQQMNLLRSNSRSRQSRSIERNQMRRESQLQCMNMDGRSAKYKVVKINDEEEDQSDFQEEQPLYYCYQCVIPLVEQGFTVEQLTSSEKIKIKITNKTINNFHQSSSSRLRDSRSSSRYGDDPQQDKIRMNQLKSKVVLKINKIKACRQQFQAIVRNNQENIDAYYDSLIAAIQERRLIDRKNMTKSVNNVKNGPERYEQQLNSALGTIDYLLRQNSQGTEYQCIAQIQALLDNQQTYSIDSLVQRSQEQLQQSLQHFTAFFDQQFRLSFTSQSSAPRHQSEGCYTRSSHSILQPRTNAPRYSFESALQESKTSRGRQTYNTCYQMGPLQQQSESQLEDSIQVPGQQNQDAFRNLFPEECQDYECMEELRRSPVFKQF